MASKEKEISPTPVLNPVMVSVGGITPELEKCNPEKEQTLALMGQTHFGLLSKIKGTLYKFKVEEIIVYIEEGCTFRVDKVGSKNRNSVMVIAGGSVFAAHEIRYCTDYILISDRSEINIIDEISIGDVVIKSSSISAINARIFRSTIENSIFDSKEIFENFDNWQRNVTIDGFTSIRFRKSGYNGLEEFSLIANEDANHHLMVKDVNLPSHYQDFSCLECDLDINIINRVDIGTFAGVRPLPFVRSDRADLVVTDVLFAETEFFQPEDEPDIGFTPISTIDKSHSSIIKTRAMMEEHKQWGDFVFKKKELRRSTDTEHMLVKSILMGIVSRINVFKTLEALR